MFRRIHRASKPKRASIAAAMRCFGHKEREMKSSSELRPIQAGTLRSHIDAAASTAAWGPSEPNLIADPDAALRFWLQCGFDPLLSLPGPTEVRTTEDAWGTDLSSHDVAVLKESLAFWTAHYSDKWLRTLRLSRRTGASQIGMLRDTPVVDDEVDNAATSWGDDLEFARLYSQLREVIPERPANLEQLEMVIRRSTPETYAKIALIMVTRGTPHTYAPVATTAPFHVEGAEAVTAWATKFQQARLDAEPVLTALRNAVEQRRWPAVAAALADKLAAINAVRSKRLARQAQAGIRPAWESLNETKKTEIAADEAHRVATGVLTKELDVEEKLDNSEAWLEEHEEICKIADEPIADAAGVTFKSVWIATACLEALEFEHLYSASHPAFRTVHARSLRKLLDEHTLAELYAVEETVLRQSTFDPRNGDLVPSANALPAAYSKAHWWRYCGPGVVTQHTESGIRQLLHSHQSIGSVTAAISLHYGLRSLSSSLDYSTPFKHRHSLVRVLSTYSVSNDRALTATTNDTLRSMHRVEDVLSALKDVIAWPVGVMRRAEQRATRARHEQADHPILNARVLPAAEENLAERAKYGVTDLNAWLLGSTRAIQFDWAAITKLAPAVHTNQATQTLQRLAQKRSVGIEVTLWKKIEAGKGAPTARSTAEAERFASTMKTLAGRSPQYASVAKHVAWEMSRIVRAPVDVPSAPVVEPNDDGFEFVTVLADNHQGEFDGVIRVTLPHLRNAVSNEAGAPIDKGIYRLRIRGFQHDVNPDHHPTRASQAYTAEFAVEDVLEAALTAHGATERVLPADSFISFFDSLRKAGLAINTGLEFEAGQCLTKEGHAVTAKVKSLIQEAHFASLGSRAGLSSAECLVEPKVRAHWFLHHPGATEEEWQCVRRFVLARALRTEQDWWSADDNLTVLRPFDVANEADSRLRYGVDLASTLQAEGHSGAFTATGSIAMRPAVAAAYTGTGAVASLVIDKEACGADSLDNVLRRCTEAIDAAQVRLNTLSAQRLSELERGTKYLMIDSRHGIDFGGIHGRTYRLAYDNAVAKLDLQA